MKGVAKIRRAAIFLQHHVPLKKVGVLDRFQNGDGQLVQHAVHHDEAHLLRRLDAVVASWERIDIDFAAVGDNVGMMVKMVRTGKIVSENKFEIFALCLVDGRVVERIGQVFGRT